MRRPSSPGLSLCIKTEQQRIKMGFILANRTFYQTPRCFLSYRAPLALILEHSRTDLFDDDEMRLLHWARAHALAGLNVKTPWDFSSAITDFIGSKDFSLNALGLGYVSVCENVKDELLMAKSGGNLQTAFANLASFTQYWDQGLPIVLTELLNWMCRPAYPSDSANGKEIRGGQRTIISQDGAFSFN